MIDFLSLVSSTVSHIVGAAFLLIAAPISFFFGYTPYIQPTQPLPLRTESETTTVATTSEIVLAVATSSPPQVAPIPKKATPVVIIVPQKPPTTPVIIVPPQQHQPINPGASTTPPVLGTSTPSNTIGTTTLAAQSVPLLTGGIAHAGESVAISYLQITNVGREGALLKGFWVKQNGSAPGQSIIGLSTVDDMGGSRGLAGGVEGATPFQNGVAFAPTDAFFAPGQMRLFTIKAIMTQAGSPYIGTQLVITVEAIETTAAVQAQFPIRGTIWTIEN